jgi:hypothetical protein
MIALLAAGVLSIAISSQTEVWWTKSASKSKHHPQIARIVNAAYWGINIDDDASRDRATLNQAIAAAKRSQAAGTNPNPPRQIAILSDEMSGQILSLSHLLNPDITLILTPEGTTPTISTDYDRVFLYRSSEALHAALATRDRVQFKPYISWLDEVITPK